MENEQREEGFLERFYNKIYEECLVNYHQEDKEFRGISKLSVIALLFPGSIPSIKNSSRKKFNQEYPIKEMLKDAGCDIFIKGLIYNSLVIQANYPLIESLFK